MVQHTITVRPYSSFGGVALPIKRMVDGAVFGPDDIALLVEAFDRVCGALQLGTADPMRETVAHTVIMIASLGERDPRELYEHSLKAVLGQK